MSIKFTCVTLRHMSFRDGFVLVTQRGFEPEINHHIRPLSGGRVAFRVACYPKSLLKYASTLSSTAERSALNVC